MNEQPRAIARYDNGNDPVPIYAAHAWLCILNPGEATAAQARSLPTDAHGRLAQTSMGRDADVRFR